jgi:hypothetical protein
MQVLIGGMLCFAVYCGGKLEHESKFCNQCGRDVSSAQTSMTQAQPQIQIPSSPVQLTPSPVQIPKAQNTKGRYLLFGACGMTIGAILMAIILLLVNVTGISGMLGKASVSETAGASGTASVSDKASIPSFGGGTIEGPGFAMPEDAAKAYLMGLKAQDMGAMLSTFAIESYVDNYDFEVQIERLMMYQYNAEIRFPNTNDYARRMNIASRASQITGLIIYQYMKFNTPEALNNSKFVTIDPGTTSDFIKKFERDTKDYIFEDLEITGTQKPEDLCDVYLNKKNQEAIANHAKTFGADIEDVANVVITFEANGDDWIFCPQLVRYNGKWYMQMLQVNLANIMAFEHYNGGIIGIN